jgi:hypothetical protein
VRDEAAVGPFCLEDLGRLHARLTPEERDELLQCLLVAASLGGEAMADVLEQTLLCHATEELLLMQEQTPRARPSDNQGERDGD